MLGAADPVVNKMGVVLSEGTPGKCLHAFRKGIMGSTNSALEDEEHTAGVAIALGEEPGNV